MELICVSIGDQFARWTSMSFKRLPSGRLCFTSDGLLDDIFKSTIHRAINRSGVERYSLPLFFGTDYDVELVVSLLSDLETY